MIWYVVMQLFSTVLEWVRIGRLSEREKDLEILVLRKQLMIMEQQLEKPVRLSRVERLTLAVISAKLKTVSGRSLKQLRDVIRLVQPETVFKWHRELVRRKWTPYCSEINLREDLGLCNLAIVITDDASKHMSTTNWTFSGR
jgi:hypothetical protein